MRRVKAFAAAPPCALPNAQRWVPSDLACAVGCPARSARDVVRPEAPQAVGMLSSMGVRAAMLTGDAPAAAAGVGAATGIPPPRVHARLLPGEKLVKVRALQRLPSLRHPALRHRLPPPADTACLLAGSCVAGSSGRCSYIQAKRPLNTFPPTPPLSPGGRVQAGPWHPSRRRLLPGTAPSGGLLPAARPAAAGRLGGACWGRCERRTRPGGCRRRHRHGRGRQRGGSGGGLRWVEEGDKGG